MAQVGNNENRFGGEYMIQDRDHMSEIDQTGETANRARQAEQAQSGNRQQGDNREADQSQGNPRGGRQWL